MPLPAGFVKLEDVRNSTNGKKEHRKYRGVYYLDEGDTNEYAFNTRINGIDGTRVPKSAEQGGVEGSQNPYGTVVLGKVIGRDDATLGDVPPPELLQTKVAKDEARRPMSVELARDLDALEKEIPVQRAPAPRPEVLPMAPAFRSPAPAPEIAVAISSPTFGSYKGKYCEVQITDEFIVLGFDPEASAFTPPVREEPEELALKTGGKTYPAFYTGIEFTLESLGVTLQVFARKQE